jgi:hypothetical protein
LICRCSNSLRGRPAAAPVPAPDPLEALAASLLPIVFSASPPRSSRLRPVVIGWPHPVVRLPRRVRGRWRLLARQPVAGTFPVPGRVPVAPLQQLNLKLPSEVLDHWRAQAAAEGLSVRDWLVSRVGPAAPAAGAELAERVAELERVTADLAAAVGELRGAGAAPRSPLPEPEARPVDPLPLPPRREGEPLTSAELADRYGINRGSLNNWAAAHPIGAVRRHPRAGAWRLAGKAAAPGGGPLRWLWEPAGEG